ncbi:hypothetical protein LCGC14_0092700 [marine sediment metagenome]|uniref:histidine kinase n=1 Tax=marine sediment metagenome TaxID=412755 RepID=A0A0F9VV70_9ZZZZ|nr:HAMP domain-containing protein [Halopseudomonas sabulinigri]
MPRRHSLFWRLVLLVAGFCTLLIAASDYLGARIDRETSFLSDEAVQVLSGYGEQAQRALQKGPAALDAWRAALAERETIWLVVVDADLQPLGNQQLSVEQQSQLTFVRHFKWPMSLRSQQLPLVAIPLAADGAQLILRLPEQFRPWQNRALLNALVMYALPILLSVLFCGLLYWLLISPLEQLRRQANALRANPLEALLPESMAQRRDELGELGRSLEYLTQRLRDSVTQQRQLLRDLSHELRTPLSRLRVASESELSLSDLRDRLERETGVMQTLVDSTLELAWLDSEQPQQDCEQVDIAALWDVLREDALFESGWPAERITATVPSDCAVQGNLNALAQAMENILRNAIRYSPPEAVVNLSAQAEPEHWCLCIADQGPGVPESELEVIFRPFARLCQARPGGSGFGLGLAIAEGMVRLQGGRIWAENAAPGLRVKIRLAAV